MALPAILLFISSKLYSATTSDNELTYEIETRASFAGGENTPFWLISNIDGLGSPQFNNGYVRGKVIVPLKDSKKFNWGAGVDIADGWHLPAAFSIRQLYAEMHYRALYIGIGSKNFSSDYNDRLLSSGDLLFSGNSMAIPQVKIGTNGFAPFWGTKGWFSVKAYLSYGYFTDSNWQKNWIAPGSNRTSGVLFCGRGLWFRFGNDRKFPLTADIGINMGTQFGGKVYKNNTIINMPSKFIDWIKAFVPLPGNEDTPEDEQTNVQGNMAGEYNIAINYAPTPDWNLSLYYEHYFEDHSQMFLEYGVWKDGLWGIKIEFPENRFISKMVYEFVYTKDQTGSVLHNTTPEIPEQVSGQDGYFDHYLYGPWQNWGMSLGTPLAISPLYNRNHILFMYDTRFSAHHFGVEGKPIPGLDWRLLMTFTNNLGTYFRPFPYAMNNYSGLLEVNYIIPPLKGLFVKGAIAWDKGKLLGNNFGGIVSIGYQGKIAL